jgi:archaellum component FlaC
MNRNANTKMHRKSERYCAFIKEDGHRCNIPFEGFSVRHVYCAEHKPDDAVENNSSEPKNLRNRYARNTNTEDMRLFIVDLMERDSEGLLGKSNGRSKVEKELKELKKEVKELKKIVKAVNKENKKLRKDKDNVSSIRVEMDELNKTVEKFRKTTLINSGRFKSIRIDIDALKEKWGL